MMPKLRKMPLLKRTTRVKSLRKLNQILRRKKRIKTTTIIPTLRMNRNPQSQVKRRLQRSLMRRRTKSQCQRRRIKISTTTWRITTAQASQVLSRNP